MSMFGPILSPTVELGVLVALRVVPTYPQYCARSTPPGSLSGLSKEEI